MIAASRADHPVDNPRRSSSRIPDRLPMFSELLVAVETAGTARHDLEQSDRTVGT